MTISVAPMRNEYEATAGQAVFTYTFKIFEDTDLNVYVTPADQVANDSTDQVTPTLVTGVGNEAGGTVTISATSAGDLVTIVGDIPASRTTDYQNNGDFRPTVVNNDFDRVVSLVKQVEDLAGRSILFQESQQNTQQLSWPVPQAGKLVRWRGDLLGFENVEVTTEPIGTNVGSIAGLRNLDINDFSAGDSVFVDGYYTTGDGGGGPRRILFTGAAPGTYVDNGGSIIVPTGGDGSAAWIVPSSAVMSILEWGGSPDAADNLTQVQSWKDSVPSGTLIFPDLGGSVYTLSAAPTGVGTGYVYRMEGSARFGAVVPLGTIEYDYNQQGTETTYKLLQIEGDTVDQPAIAGSKVNGSKTLHEFGGSTTKGGRHAGYNVLIQTAETASDNTDRFYVSTVGQTIGSSSTGDGGTVGSEKGSLFACNFITNAYSNYTNATAISGGEINTKIESGATTLRHTLLQLVTDDEVQGSYLDAGLAIGAKSGAVGLKYGIFIGYGNGGNPMDTTGGILIGAAGDAGALNCKTGIDVSGYRFTDAVLNSHYAKITAFGTIVAGASDGSTASPAFQLRSSGLSARDASIVCTGGDATTNNGNLTFQAASILVNNTFRPNADNTIDLGVAAFRWKEIFAGNAVINTSDRDQKTAKEAIPDEVLDAWSTIEYCRFKFLDSVAVKGDQARYHVGLIAQDIKEAFEAKGLDATEYGILCYDEWEEEKDSNGEITVEAGSQWGIRADECQFLELALMRRELNKLKTQS